MGLVLVELAPLLSALDLKPDEAVEDASDTRRRTAGDCNASAGDGLSDDPVCAESLMLAYNDVEGETGRDGGIGRRDASSSATKPAKKEPSSLVRAE